MIHWQKPDRRSQQAYGLRMRRGRLLGEFHLNLTSLIDTFTIILIFLIKSYSAADAQMSAPREVDLPRSTATTMPSVGVKVSVSLEGIDLEESRVISLKQGEVGKEDLQGLVIVPLFRTLQVVALERLQAEKENPTKEFKREVVLFADRRIPYATLKRVLFTAGQAQFETFRFSVLRVQ